MHRSYFKIATSFKCVKFLVGVRRDVTERRHRQETIYPGLKGSKTTFLTSKIYFPRVLTLLFKSFDNSTLGAET